MHLVTYYASETKFKCQTNTAFSTCLLNNSIVNSQKENMNMSLS